MKLETIYKIIEFQFINDSIAKKLAEENDKVALALAKIKKSVEDCKKALETGNEISEEKVGEKLEGPLSSYALLLASNENAFKEIVGKEKFEEHSTKVYNAKRNLGFNLWALTTYASELEKKGLLRNSKLQDDKESESELDSSSVTDNSSVKSKNSSDKKQKNPLEDIHKKLLRLKTFSSSREYGGIITMVEFAMNNESWEGAEELTAEERFISKMIAIKSTINKYINHKAESGVKQNAFKKLAAVEELNKMVEHYLELVDFNNFRYGETIVSRKNYQLNFEEELGQANYKKFRNPKYKAYMPISEDDAEIQQRLVNDKYPEATAKEIMNADGCMARIILSALNHHKVTDVKVDRLFNMQKELLNNPANEKAPEVVRPSVVPSK